MGYFFQTIHPRKRQKTLYQALDEEHHQQNSKRRKARTDWTGHGLGELRIDHLPNEVLQQIFVYTQESILPLCNKRLYGSLSGDDAHLQRRYLREAMRPVKSGCMALPVDLLERRFVTAEVLAQMSIEYFCDDHGAHTAHFEHSSQNADPPTRHRHRRVHIPVSIERKPISERRLRLIEYIIKRGLVPHHSKRLIPELIENGLIDIARTLVEKGSCYDHRAVLTALHANHEDFAKELITKTTVKQSNLWEFVLENDDSRAYEFLKQIGSQPPWEVMKKYMARASTQ